MEVANASVEAHSNEDPNTCQSPEGGTVGLKLTKTPACGIITVEADTAVSEASSVSETMGGAQGARGVLTSARLLLRTMRPKQWTKNVFVWAALVFDHKLFQAGPFLRTLITFLLFCLITSAVYIINDLVDVEKDRQHPSKRNRPLASGALSPRLALVAAVVIILLSLPAALWLGTLLAIILYGYLLLMIAYSFVLKNIVIVDVLTIAAGFVLRVAAGVVVVRAERFSPWIYVCMVLLALFLAIGKRRQEIVLMQDGAQDTRTILQEYNVTFLDEMLALVSSTTVMAYSLYTFSAPNVPANHTLMLTIPFVLYGLFRYLYLIHVRGETDPPDVVVLKDRALLVDVVLFAVVAFLVFYVF
jgi:4-hydroxybenzoate polyprenyltransferase